MNNAVVMGSYASALLDYLRSRGVDPQRLFAAQHQAAIDHLQTHGQVSLCDWLSMFEIASQALDEPDLALKAGARININHLGVLGPVLMNCQDLSNCFSQLARYIRLLGEFGLPTMQLEGESAHFVLSWPYGDEPPSAVVQFMSAARITMSRWLSARADLAWDAYFQFAAPADTATYQRVFGGALYFEQAHNKIVAPLADLRLPVVSADTSLRLQAESKADAILQHLSHDVGVVHSLRKYLIDQLESGQISVERAARRMDMNTRTLQRRLKAEGRSFQQVLDEVRQARAREYLRDPSLQLAQIAFLLGYSEQSAFQYAFKQWTTLTPGEFRDSLGVKT